MALWRKTKRPKTQTELAERRKQVKERYGETPYYAPYKMTPEYRKYLKKRLQQAERDWQERQEQLQRKRKQRKPVKKTKPEFKTVRTKYVEKGLRGAGLTEEEIRRLRSKK